MIISMPIIARSQQRYEHRLRTLVQRTGDVTVATDLGVPSSTARGWLAETPTVVVCLDVTEDGRDKLRILRAVDRARECLPLRPLLRFLRVSPSRFHAWAAGSMRVCSTIILPVRAHPRLD